MAGIGNWISKNPFMFMLAVVAVLGVAYLSTGAKLQVGGTVLSLDQISYANAPTDMNTAEKVWVANVIANDGGQLISGATESRVLSSVGITAQKPITVGVSLEKQSCNYGVKTQYVSMDKLTIVGKSVYAAVGTSAVSAECAAALIAAGKSSINVGAEICTNPLTSIGTTYLPITCYNNFATICANNGGTAVSCPTDYTGGSYGKMCVDYAPVAGERIQGFDLDPKQTVGIYKVSVSNGLTTKYVTVGNDNGYSNLNLSNDKAVRVMLSNFVDSLAISCPSETAGKYMVYATSVKKQAIPSTIWTQYYESEPPILTGYTLADVQKKRDIHNENWAQIKNAPAWSSNGTTSTYSSGMVILDRTNNPSAFGQLQVWIKASYLGILEPLAKPSISKITPDPVGFNSLDQRKDVAIEVYNSGDEGAVYLSTSCPSGVSITSGTQNKVIGASSSGTFTVNLGGNQGNYTCAATVKNAQATATNSKTFKVIISPTCQISCSPPRSINSATCACNCATTCPTGKIQQDDCTCTDAAQVNPCGNGKCDFLEQITCSKDCTGTTPPSGSQDCSEKIDARVCGTLDFACPIDKFFGKIGCVIESAVENLMMGLFVFGGIVLLIVAAFLFTRKRGGKK